jgi:hypothetical protein
MSWNAPGPIRAPQTLHSLHDDLKNIAGYLAVEASALEDRTVATVKRAGETAVTSAMGWPTGAASIGAGFRQDMIRASNAAAVAADAIEELSTQLVRLTDVIRQVQSTADNTDYLAV